MFDELAVQVLEALVALRAPAIISGLAAWMKAVLPKVVASPY
jgi:hypothetical protein